MAWWGKPDAEVKNGDLIGSKPGPKLQRDTSGPSLHVGPTLGWSSHVLSARGGGTLMWILFLKNPNSVQKSFIHRKLTARNLELNETLAAQHHVFLTNMSWMSPSLLIHLICFTARRRRRWSQLPPPPSPLCSCSASIQPPLLSGSEFSHYLSVSHAGRFPPGIITPCCHGYGS